MHKGISAQVQIEPISAATPTTPDQTCISYMILLVHHACGLYLIIFMRSLRHIGKNRNKPRHKVSEQLPHIWANAWQNKQSGMCDQQRLLSA